MDIQRGDLIVTVAGKRGIVEQVDYVDSWVRVTYEDGDDEWISGDSVHAVSAREGDNG